MSSREIAELVGLNPFEIRASLKRLNMQKMLLKLSLNPFEIRASLKRITVCRWFCKFVLIPLKSGQA